MGLPSHSGGPLYIQVLEKLPADQTNINSKSRWAGLSPPPCPQSQRRPQPAITMVRHSARSLSERAHQQSQEQEQDPNAEDSQDGRTLRGRCHYRRRRCSRRRLYRIHRRRRRSCRRRRRRCCRHRRHRRCWSSPIYSRSGHLTPPDRAQKGSGRLVIPWDPTPFDSPQSPAPPRLSGLPYDQNFLFQKVAEDAGGEDTEGVVRPSWAHPSHTWLEIKEKSPDKEPPHMTTAIPPCWMPKP